ncbi:Fibronectin type III domain protein [Rhizobium freirei PRF 81]|uniref:Fibronectin type III domain protein n=1 Tax=Rhizobium freirei PRF 81 TaxID=363754 RepID=N6U5P9_9HYPH|nr:carbohydrate binding domain-containing protein [Rhizobium freirei]ENN85573.1 Fibronectin type III domain protein [Rhizobium freirei PRF 81]
MDAAITSLKLADQAVSTAKLQVAAVTADVLASGAVIDEKLADGAVSARAMAQGAVDATKFASGIRPVEIVTTFPQTGNVEGRIVYHKGAGKLYRYTKGAWTAAVDAGDVNGTLNSAQIADAAITISKLAQGAVDATKFASGIKPVEVVDAFPTTGNVEGRQVFLTTDGKLYRYHNGAWTSATAADDIAGQIVGTQISDGAISTPKLGAGVVTADKIAANSITAGQIAAGAIGATQIAAGAVSTDKLAANVVSTNKLAVGSGVNLLQNSSFTMGTDCWANVPWGTIPNLSLAITPLGWSWSGKTNPTLRLWQNSGPAGSNTYADIRWLRADGGSLAGSLKYAVPCVPGEWFETTAYVSAHRCQVELYIAWIGADGTEVGYSSTGSNTNNAIAGDANNPDLWLRLRVTGAAPANAVAASILIRKRDTQAGGADSYAFINKPMLCRIPAGATEATPWSDGGIVLITSGGIVANAVTAGKIAANAVTAGTIAANAVTAGTIAANAVTAGTIAAGAVSAAQIAAGAITTDKLAAGSVSTQALAVGTGGNFLSNSDLLAGMTGWAAEYSNDASSFTIGLRTDTYAPVPGAIEIRQTNANQGIEYGVMATDAYGNRREFAVKANGWYELSVYYFGHRCNGVQPYLGVFDAAGNLIAYPNWGIFPAYQNFDPQKSLANYSRFWGKVQMPANAAKAMVFFRMKGTVAGQGDSYLWLTRMYFGEANANQTEASPWSDGSVTVINGGNIATGAVSADKIAANAVTVGKIAAGAVTATAIAAGAVTAASIAAGTITGDKLAANTIGANQIAAGAITAKSLVLTDFSNMVDNGWQGGNLDGWGIQNLQNFYPDNSSGDQAGYVVQSLGRDCCWSKSIAVTPGETYAFDVWVYNTDANTANIYAALYTGAGAISYYPVVSTTAKNSWVRLQGRFTIPSGFAKLAMLLQVDKTAGTGGSCYWSKPVMRRATSGELIVDGAITGNKIAANAITAAQIATGAITTDKLILGGVTYDKIASGAVTAMNAGRVADQQVIGAGSTVNLAAVGISVDGDSRVMINAMTLGQYNLNGGSQNAQPIGCNIFRDGLAIFSQTYYLGVVQTIVQTSGGGSSNGTGITTTQYTYTAGLVGVPALYDAPGPGYHVYTLQIYCPNNNIGWRESNIVATAFKR